MKIVVVEPFKNPYVAEINGSLESFQKVVGGYIEVIYPFNDCRIALVCNENGKIDYLTPNRFILNRSTGVFDCICGDFFFCYAPPEAEEFQSLPDDLSERLIKKFSER